MAATPRRTMPVGSAMLAILVALAIGFGGGWLYKKGTTTTTTTTIIIATTTTAPATTTTTAPPALACSASVLSGTVQSSGGAAGTIEMTIDVSNGGATTCVLRGYPTIKLVDSNSRPMTTLPVFGQAVFGTPAANAAPKKQRVTSGGHVEFVLQFSDVPSGTEHTCPQAASINVYPPGSPSSFNVVATIAPCNSGTVHVSPFFGGT